MTTEQGRVFREESLEVLDINKGKVEIKPSWTKFPMKVTRNRDSMQDEAEMMEMLVEGAMAGFILVRESPKDNQSWGDERDWWWGIWAVGDPMVGAAAMTPDEAATSEGTEWGQTDENPKAHQPAEDTRSFTRHVDPKGDSIERQVAAKAATELGIAFAPSNDGRVPSDMWDSFFYHVIARIQGTEPPA